MIQEKRFISTKELSQMIGIHRNSIYRWVSQERIPCNKIGGRRMKNGRIKGGRTRFDMVEIDKWLKGSSVACKNFDSLTSRN